jgi:hypothetical protein
MRRILVLTVPALALAACGSSSPSSITVHGIVLGGPIAPACADFYHGGQVTVISGESGKTLAHATLHKNAKASKGMSPVAYVYDFTAKVPSGLKHYIFTVTGPGGSRTIAISGRKVAQEVRLTCSNG